jgi:hypothetical protein
MSGGSYDYAFGKVEDFIDSLKSRRNNSLLRRAFITHLSKVSQAMRDIEWVDSCDYAKGDEDKAIRDCLGSASDGLCVMECIKSLNGVIAESNGMIDKLRGGV